MAERENPYVAAEAYIHAHALDARVDARSIEPQHLDHLLTNLRITRGELARLLKIPRWLLRRMLVRVQPKQFQPKRLRSRPIRPRIPGTGSSRSLKATWLPVQQAHVRGVHQAAYEKALEYIAGLDLSKRSTLAADEVRYLYSDLGLPQKLIGNLLGVSEVTVRNWLRAASVTSRTVAETKTQHYNVTFFREWSPAMAWVLGLLYTDGNLTRNTVSLSSTDIELLEKVRNLVSPKHTISVYRQTYRPGTIGRFSMNHVEMCTDIKRLGLVNKKSLIMEFPSMPEDCVRHFIRGCWDGDGGFSGSDEKLSGHYTCGSRKFVEDLAIHLFNAGVVTQMPYRKSNGKPNENLSRTAELIARYGNGPYPPTIYQRRNAQAFDLRIGLPSALERLHEYFYKGVDSSIYLSRKFEKLNSFVLAKRKPGVD